MALSVLLWPNVYTSAIALSLHVTNLAVLLVRLRWPNTGTRSTQISLTRASAIVAFASMLESNYKSIYTYAFLGLPLQLTVTNVTKDLITFRPKASVFHMLPEIREDARRDVDRTLNSVTSWADSCLADRFAERSSAVDAANAAYARGAPVAERARLFVAAHERGCRKDPLDEEIIKEMQDLTTILIDATARPPRRPPHPTPGDVPVTITGPQKVVHERFRWHLVEASSSDATEFKEVVELEMLVVHVNTNAMFPETFKDLSRAYDFDRPLWGLSEQELDDLKTQVAIANDRKASPERRAEAYAAIASQAEPFKRYDDLLESAPWDPTRRARRFRRYVRRAISWAPFCAPALMLAATLWPSDHPPSHVWVNRDLPDTKADTLLP